MKDQLDALAFETSIILGETIRKEDIMTDNQSWRFLIPNAMCGNNPLILKRKAGGFAIIIPREDEKILTDGKKTAKDYINESTWGYGSFYGDGSFWNMGSGKGLNVRKVMSSIS